MDGGYDPEFTPSEFVAVINQTLDFAYPTVRVIGELRNFRVSRGKWVYFDVIDDLAAVKCFSTIYALPGPLEDGMTVAIIGRPQLHAQYGFSVTVSSISPAGQGAIKKAAELLRLQLEKEGLFAPERKRIVPYPPTKIALITSMQSAAYVDFTTILAKRYGGISIDVYDVQVQGEQAISDIVGAFKQCNESSAAYDAIIVTRGGGSSDDLQAFSHEAVVRAVAGSRYPTVVAIGHEIDESLAELAADVRASTPSNAAEILVPDRKELMNALLHKSEWLRQGLSMQLSANQNWLNTRTEQLQTYIMSVVKNQTELLATKARLLEVLSPHAALQRGYAIIKSNHGLVSSVQDVQSKDKIAIQVSDGIINASVE